MSKIVCTRIDNRLIHGQVAKAWTQKLAVDILAVASDALSQDEFKQSLMKMASPAKVAVRFYTLAETIALVNDASVEGNIMILCENPQDVLALVEGGAPITEVNIGNMDMAEGKHKVATTVAVDENDVATFKALQDKSIALEIRRVPDVVSEDLDALFQ